MNSTRGKQLDKTVSHTIPSIYPMQKTVVVIDYRYNSSRSAYPSINPLTYIPLSIKMNVYNFTIGIVSYLAFKYYGNDFPTISSQNLLYTLDKSTIWERVYVTQFDDCLNVRAVNRCIYFNFNICYDFDLVYVA